MSAVLESKLALVDQAVKNLETGAADRETRLRELERRIGRIEIGLAVIVAEIPIVVGIAALVVRWLRS